MCVFHSIFPELDLKWLPGSFLQIAQNSVKEYTYILVSNLNLLVVCISQPHATVPGNWLLSSSYSSMLKQKWCLFPPTHLGPQCIPKPSIHSASPSFNTAVFGDAFSASHVLTVPEVCEWKSEGATPSSNFFLPEQNTANAFLTVDMGCHVFMTTLELRNTHNGYHNKYAPDRCTPALKIPEAGFLNWNLELFSSYSRTDLQLLNCIYQCKSPNCEEKCIFQSSRITQE